MAIDRRTGKRFLARIPLVYAGGNHGQLAKFWGNSEVIDISRAGLRFAIHHVINEGDLLGLEIYLGEGRNPLELVAEVRWKRSFNGRPHDEIGAKFLKVERSQQRSLASVLKEVPESGK